MSKTAILSVRIVGDAAKATKALDKTGAAIHRVEKQTKSYRAPAAAAAAAIGFLAHQSLKAADELQQSSGAVEAVFKNQAKTVKAAAAQAAGAVGLSASQYEDMASILGSQLNSMGTPAKELVTTTDKLIKRGADLAATFGGSTADAVSALSSLLRGERDPIEKYGISIKQADINAEKAKLGLDKLTGAAAKQADVQATLALVAQQSANASGQFAREATTAAGSAQIAAANWENAKAALGEKLLPAVTAVTNAMSTGATIVAQHSTAALVLAGVVGTLAAVILTLSTATTIYNGVQAAVKVGTMAWTAAQWLLNAALDANPIGVVVMAIAALVAGIVYAYHNSETFRNALHALWDVAKSVGSSIAGYFQPVIDLFTRLWHLAGSLKDAIVRAFSFHVPSWVSSAASWFSGSAAPGIVGQVFSLNAFTAPAPILAPTFKVNRSSSNRLTQQPSINITINGAIDPVSTARQIEQILDRGRRRRSGTASYGGIS